jgi:hypothetical protein
MIITAETACCDIEKNRQFLMRTLLAALPSSMAGAHGKS